MAYQKVMAELPTLLAEHAQPANRDAYPNWTSYIQTFLSEGKRFYIFYPYVLVHGSLLSEVH